MIIDLPKLGPVNFDDNLSPEEYQSQLEHLSKKYDFEIPKSELTLGEQASRAWTRGTKQLGSTFGDIIPAMAASAVGADEYAAKQMAEAKATQEELNKYYAPQYGKLSDVKGISDVPGFVLENFVENIPNLLVSLVPGVGAEAIAGRAALSGVTENLLAQAAKQGLSEEATQAYVVNGLQQAAKQVAGTKNLAQNAGVFLGSYAQNAPEVFQNIYDKTGQMETGAAMLWGTASAALDSILPEQILKSVTGPVKVGIVEKLLERSGMEPGLVRSIASNVLKDAGYEGLTEGAQEAISISAEKFIGNNPQVFNSDDWNRIIEAGVRGSVAGGPLGVATGAAEHFKTTPAYTEALDKAKETGKRQEVEAPIGTQGTGIFYVYADGRVATSEEAVDVENKAQKDRAKAENNQARQAAKRLKTFLKAKQASLDLQPAPPAGGVETTEQPDLFGAPPTPEPTKVTKPVPPTAQTLGTVIGTDKPSLTSFGKALGIGHSAAILRADGPLAGKDLSNPADAAEVKRILEAYAEGKPAAGAVAKIEEFLKRPEFAAQPEETQNGIRSGLIPGASEPSVPSTGEAVPNQEPAGGVSEPVEQGVGVSGQPVESVNGGEGAVEPALGVKEAKDLAKAEAAIEPAVAEQKAHAAENDARTLEYMKRDLPEDLDVEDLDKTDAFKYLRLPSLLQEYFRLRDVIANSDKSERTERAQIKKNEAERAAIKKAIVNSDPNVAKLLSNLEESPQYLPGFLEKLNKDGRDLLAGEIKTRVEKAAQEKEKAAAEAKEAVVDETIDKILENRVARKVSAKIAEAVDKGDTKEIINEIINEAENPEIKAIFEKVKKMGLKTKVTKGKVTRKKGTLGAESDIGVYDPATDTITLDPDLGLTTHNVAHELMHAAISHVLRNPNHPLTKQLTAIYEATYNQLGSAYGARDIQEFAAELAGNPQFRSALQRIKAPKSGNMLQRIISHIAEFFGFRKGQSAYDAAIKTLNDILDVAPGEPKSTGEQMFNIFSDAREAMPTLGKQTIESTLNTFSNLKGMDYKTAGLSVMRLDHINKIWGNKLPAIQKLLDNLEKRKGYIEAQIKNITKNYNNFLNLSKTEKAAFNRMQDMAYDARLEKAGRIDEGFKPTPIPPKASFKKIAEIRKADLERKAAYDKHRAVFDKLPKSLQQAYTTILNDYKKSFEQYKDLLLNSTDSLSLKQKIKAKFEAVEHIDGYIPFLRRGDFWVRYIDPATGEEAASAFQSQRQRDKFIDEVLNGAEHTKYQKIQDAKFSSNTVPSTSFIAQVIAGLNTKDANGKVIHASNEQIDNVYQAYLALFPAESLSKKFMHSNDVRGMERDIARGYNDTMLKWSRKLGDSIYAPKIDKAVEEIRAKAESSGDDNLIAVGRNIVSQKDFFHNPTFNNFIHGVTALSYFEYITGNLSSALVNLTSLPLLVLPMLGGRFGFTKTSNAMLAAHKIASQWVMKNDNLNPRYKALYQMLQDHAQLEHTMARELLEGRRQSTEDYTGLKARVLDGLSIPFSATEKYNRAVTAIAAYDLAKANGFSEEKALRLALDTVKDAHTSGMAETAPKWMQNPLGRVFFTFKTFAWNSAFIVARAFEQSFRGETKEIRDAARRQLLGTFFMAGVFGGVKGLPFMGLAQTIGQMLHALFGDDDEPFDFNEELRAFFGELIYKGPVNYVTNLEISNRVGLAQDLVWRDDPRASSGLVLGAMQRAFGPAGSYLVNVEHAYDMFNQGHTERAIEAVMPSFFRNFAKGGRYMVEGATTVKGLPIIDDVSTYNSLMQIIGFSPADLSSTYEKGSAKYAYQKEVLDKRQRLLDKYEMGRVGGDADLMGQAREEITKFNVAHPKEKITGETLARSQAARKAAIKNTIDGVTLNKKLIPEIQEKFGTD